MCERWRWLVPCLQFPPHRMTPRTQLATSQSSDQRVCMMFGLSQTHIFYSISYVWTGPPSPRCLTCIYYCNGTFFCVWANLRKNAMWEPWVLGWEWVGCVRRKLFRRLLLVAVCYLELKRINSGTLIPWFSALFALLPLLLLLQYFMCFINLVERTVP